MKVDDRGIFLEKENSKKKSTPEWFEHSLPKEMAFILSTTSIAGHRVNHSAKLQIVSYEYPEWWIVGYSRAKSVMILGSGFVISLDMCVSEISRAWIWRWGVPRPAASPLRRRWVIATPHGKYAHRETCLHLNVDDYINVYRLISKGTLQSVCKNSALSQGVFVLCSLNSGLA